MGLLFIEDVCIVLVLGWQHLVFSSTGHLLLMHLYGPFLGHIGAVNACWFFLPLLVYLASVLIFSSLGFNSYFSILHLSLGPIDVRIEL
jgi:hypothetical protein